MKWAGRDDEVRQMGYVDCLIWLIVIGMVSIAEALRQKHNENVEILLGRF